MDKRVFIYHPDERIRNILLGRLVGRKELIVHPTDTPVQLRKVLDLVPSCDISVSLIDFYRYLSWLCICISHGVVAVSLMALYRYLSWCCTGIFHR